MNDYLVSQLKKGRLNKGLKQSDVTKKTGIKNTTLSNYENGITEPDIDTFLSLCELYELDFVSLMEEAYGIKVPGKDFHIKPSEIKLLEKYNCLDAHGKEVVDFILEKECERSAAEKERTNNVDDELYGYDNAPHTVEELEEKYDVQNQVDRRHAN